MPPVAIESALRCDNGLDAYGASWPLLDSSEGWADSVMMLDHSSTDGNHVRSDSRNETMAFFYTMVCILQSRYIAPLMLITSGLQAKSSTSQTQEVGSKFGPALEAVGVAGVESMKVGQTDSITHSQRVKLLQSRPKPRCWEHGCSGREFATFSLLLRHQRGMAAKTAVYCPSCNASFARTTGRNSHLLHGKCKQHQCDAGTVGLETDDTVCLESRAAQPTSDTENISCSKLRAPSRLNSLSLVYKENPSLTQDLDVDTDESCETTTSPGSTCFDSEDEPGPLPLSERKRLLLDKLMVFFYSILSESSLHNSYQSRGSGTGRARNGHQGQGSHSSSGQGSSIYHSPSTSPRDFRTQGKRNFDRDDEDEREGKRPRASNSSQSDIPADSDAKLVCPFFRRNPGRYQQQRSCLGPGWGTVHRVK
jgi:hypothetical protein